MNFFDRKFSILLLLFTLPLLFLPKINLINLDVEETAGLRIDDLVLFFLGILLMWAHALSYQRLYKVEYWLLVISALAIFSFLMNRFLVSADLLYMNAKIFYSLRLLEYFLFFYIGAIASRFFQDRLIIRAFFVWNLLLMTLQKLNLAGGIIATGYLHNVSARVQGIASFPSEMGLLLNLIFCYFIFDLSPTSRLANHLFQSPAIRYCLHKLYLYGMFFLFGIFIIFTGNRISIVALLICFLCRLKQELNLRSIGSMISLLLFLPIIALAIGITIKHTAGVYERSVDLFSFKNFELFHLVWDTIDITQNPIGNEVIQATNYDMSWWLRIHKWLFMTKSYLYNPECYLQGLGPGYAGVALDGGLLRILTEYGLIGAFCFWKFFACLYRLNLQTKWMMIAFLINMIFFDAYLASKTMSLLLFICGYQFERQFCSQEIVNCAIFKNKSPKDQPNFIVMKRFKVENKGAQQC
jgi:hypothetical protein